MQVSSEAAPGRSATPRGAPGRACGCPSPRAAAAASGTPRRVTIASPSAVWRPSTGTPSRSAIASSRCDAWFGCTTAESSSVSSTGWSKRRPVAASFSCRKRMSKAALCATSTVSCAKAWKAGSTSSIVGLAGEHRRRDAVDGDARPRPAGAAGRPAARSIRARRSLPATMRAAPIWMISSPLEGSQPGGLGVEHGVAQLARRAVGQRTRLRRASGTGRSRRTRAGSAWRRQRGGFQLGGAPAQRQQEAEERCVAHALALEPELAAVAFDHVAHRQRRGLGRRCAWARSPSPSRSRCSSPGRSTPGRAARARRPAAGAAAAPARRTRRPAAPAR